MKLLKYIGAVGMLLAFQACTTFEEEKPDIGNSPNLEGITMNADDTDPNNPVFTYTGSEGFYKLFWDFGAGITSEGEESSSYFGFKGDYDVKLTLYSKSGNVTKTFKYSLEETDPTICENEIYNFLTGGCDALDGKIWVWKTQERAHIGVGPADGSGPVWWAAGPFEKEGFGMYDDEMTFVLNKSYDFILDNNGDTYANVDVVKSFEGDNGEDHTADPTLEYTPNEGMQWSVTEEEGKFYINLTNGGFLSYWEASNSYEILSISNDELKVMGTGSGNGWYFTFVPEGSVKTPPVVAISEPVAGAENAFTYTLDIEWNDSVENGEASWDFGNGESATGNSVTTTYLAAGEYTATVTVPTDLGEFKASTTVTVEQNHPDYTPSVEMIFQDFDGTDIVPFSFEDPSGLGSLTGVVNPDKSSPNYSAMVGEYVKNANSGQYTNAYAVLPAKLNMTEISTFKVQLRGKKGTKVELKLQNTAMGGEMWATQAVVAYEIQADDTWEEAEFDFTNAVVWTWGPNDPSDASQIKDYDKIVIQFGGEGVAPDNNPGTYYFDNLRGPSF